MNDLVPFKFESKEIRTVVDNDSIWVVAKDVVLALEYAEGSNPARLLSAVPEEWKGVKPIHTPGGDQQLWCLSEQGLYFFVARSDKSKAVPFQMWLAGEVVPTIRNMTRQSVAMVQSTDLVTVKNGSPVTTTLAIAEGTEIQHKNVLELVRKYLGDLRVFGPVAFLTRKGEALPQGGFAKATEYAILNERQSTLVISWMRNSEIVRAFKLRLVSKFYEMAEELKQGDKRGIEATKETPERRAIERIRCELEVAKLFNVPEHIAQIEAVKQANITTGVDYGHLLAHAPAQNQIVYEEEMLEPKDLGERFGISAQKINKMLAQEGYQLKGKASWIPTSLGEKFCTKHAWRRGFKSGYNLKWRVSLLDRLLQVVDTEEAA